jgi:hypothetical protein
VTSIGVALGQRVQWNAFRLTEENELFNLTQHGIDRYYTQGLRLELQYQVTRKRLLEKLMIPISGSDVNSYSLSLTQQIYTPARVDKYFFPGDHPYGGNLFLSEALESYDSTLQLRLSCRLDAGLIGPASLAEQGQFLIHKVLNGQQSVAWETQQRNDIYLNYQVKLEKAFISQASYFQLEARGEANVGSALISLVTGLNMGFGIWNNTPKKFGWQIFFKPEGRVVLFNAMIQGGILNQAYADEMYSQFFVDKIKPLIYSHRSGVRIRYDRFELLYQQVNLTREFSKQKPHYYSTIIFTIPLGSMVR